MKRILSILLILVLLLSQVGCKDKEDEETGTFVSTLKVALLLDNSDAPDTTLENECMAGLERAKTDLGIEPEVIHSNKGESYEKIIETAVMQEFDLIICAGSCFSEALKATSENYPMQPFGIIDGKVEASNVISVNFRVEEGAFLAGIAAGMTTKTKIVSFIGGEQSATSYKYLYGFQSGVVTVGKKIQLVTNYLESYADKKQGKKIAAAHHALGADIIFNEAKQAGMGVAEAAKEKDFFIISTQMSQGAICQENNLFSVLKRSDQAIYDLINGSLTGKFRNGVLEYSLANDGIYIYDPEGKLSPEIKDKLEYYKKALISGTIVAPYDWSTMHTYTTSLRK